MRIGLLIILIPCVWLCHAQGVSSKILGGKNHIEVGNTFLNYLNGNGFNQYQTNTITILLIPE
jgi:hypothetical protein